MVVLERDSCQWNLWDETWLHGGALENDRHAFCVCSLWFGGLAYIKTYVSFFVVLIMKGRLVWNRTCSVLYILFLNFFFFSHFIRSFLRALLRVIDRPVRNKLQICALFRRFLWMITSIKINYLVFSEVKRQLFIFFFFKGFYMKLTYAFYINISDIHFILWTYIWTIKHILLLVP